MDPETGYFSNTDFKDEDVWLRRHRFENIPEYCGQKHDKKIDDVKKINDFKIDDFKKDDSKKIDDFKKDDFKAKLDVKEPFKFQNKIDVLPEKKVQVPEIKPSQHVFPITPSPVVETLLAQNKNELQDLIVSLFQQNPPKPSEVIRADMIHHKEGCPMHNKPNIIIINMNPRTINREYFKESYTI
jgi:hypothetical protein